MIDFNDLSELTAPKTLGVVGSRTWPSRAFVFDRITEYLERYPSITTLVSGGQPKGVDGWAAQYAEKHEMPIIEHLPAHWYDVGDERHKPFSHSNYFSRNTLIADGSDVLLAFCWRSSRGTMDTYKKALARIGDRAHLLTEDSMRQTRHLTIFTEEDCIDTLPPELLEADTDTIRDSISDYIKEGYDRLRKSEAVVFCTPDQRFIGLKCRDMPVRTLDKANK